MKIPLDKIGKFLLRTGVRILKDRAADEVERALRKRRDKDTEQG